MINNRRRLLDRNSNAFGVQAFQRKVNMDKGKKPEPPKKKVYEEPEVMNVIKPKIEATTIELKKGESATLTSTFSDPDNVRIVKIVEDNKVVNNYTIEYLSPESFKITANEDLKGVIQVYLPIETRLCDLAIEYSLKQGIFKLPIDLSQDHEDLKITSFLIDGVEQLQEHINWDVLNMYFITPADKICKYDYVDMFYKAFSNTRISTYLDPDYVKHESELIQIFTWPSSLNWVVKLEGSQAFTIDSTKLMETEEFSCNTKIMEWENVSGQWESLWVRFDGEKIVKSYKGTWCEVVDKLLPGTGWETFSPAGLMYPCDGNFTFCLRQGNVNYLFTNSVQ